MHYLVTTSILCLDDRYDLVNLCLIKDCIDFLLLRHIYMTICMVLCVGSWVFI